MIALRRETDESGHARLSLAGELTIFTAAQTRTELLDAPPAPLALDEVERIDTAGLQVLLAWSRGGEGRSVAWSTAAEPVRQLMRRWRLPELENLR